MDLPPDLTASPVETEDLAELTEFVQATALAETGRKQVTRDQVDMMWREPGFDPTRDTIKLVDTTGALVGVEWVRSRSPHVRFGATGFVTPTRLGEGIGTALVEWARTVALGRLGEAPDRARVVLAAGVDSEHQPGVELLSGSGMDLVRHFMEMRVDFDGKLRAPVWHQGINVRQFVPGDDDVAAYLSIDEAFRDHFGYAERPLEAGLEFFRHTMASPDFDPSLFWLATEEDEVVGVCRCQPSVEGDDSIGYVGVVSVRRPWRGRGIARGLLVLAFEEFRRRGKTAATLHVDAANTTGATRLYESVGMRETERHALYETELRAGEDLSTR